MTSTSSSTGGSAGTVDLSPEMLTVRDQGSRGTCLAFAATAAHEHARETRRGQPSLQLSVEVLYWRCKQLDGFPDEDGSDFPSARDALGYPGQSAETLWPYDDQRDHTDARYVPPPGALDAAELRRASLRPLAVDLDAIRDAIASGQVVVVGIELWEAFYDCNTSSLSPPSGDLDGARHAVCFVGYDDVELKLKLRNSWGTLWGAGGYAWLPEGALTDVLVEAWVAVDDLDAE